MTMTKNQIETFLHRNRTKLEGYSFYLGDEVGVVPRDWDSSKLKMCIVFVGPYETGAGNLAVPLIQAMVKERFPNIYCDRAYAPSSRMDMKLFDENQVPLFGVESKRGLSEFDIVGFSVSYCVGLPMVLRLMKMSGIPLEAKDRTDKDPFIVGGGHSFNVYEVISPAIDAVCGGDGEATLPPMLDLALSSLHLRTDFKKKLCTIPGWYVPEFYDMTWKPNGDIEAVKPNIPEAPFPIQHAIVEDWDKSFPYIKPLIPFTDNGMGLGNVLISMGCSNKCRFCSETFSVGPYRELSHDEAFNRLKAIYDNSGSVDITPSAFSSGSYSCKKRLFKNLIEKVSNKVNLISQRVNNYSDDANFAELASFVGDKTVSLGVEGNSQRMRDRFNKNITEDQILKAIHHCMTHGYQKVKLFMIGNPPLETEEDRQEVLVLAKKIADMKAELGVKTEVKFSWTNMVLSPFTPMQFFEVTKDQLEGRHMKEIIAGLKAMGLGFRFGSGGAYDEAYFQQSLVMMDRRFYPIMKRIATVDGFIFYGNVPGGFKDKVEEYMKELGLSFAQLFKAKEKDYFFPHDIWDVGVKKDWLWQEKLKYENASLTARCKVKCGGCGACTPTMRKLNAEKWGVADPDVDISKIERIQQKGTACRLRLKVKVDADHGGVVRDYWKWTSRRAANLAGLPLNKDVIELGSDDIKIPIRVSGVDYIDMKMMEDIDPAPAIKKFMENMKGIELLDYVKLRGESGLLRNQKASALYRVSTFVSGRGDAATSGQREIGKMKQDAEEFMALKSIDPAEVEAADALDLWKKNTWLRDHRQVAQVLVPDFAKGVVRVLVDLKTVVYRVWVKEESGIPYVYMHLKQGIAPQYFSNYMFGSHFVKFKMKDASLLDTERVEYMSKLDDGQPGFFDVVCNSCGAKLYKNLIAKDVVLEGGKCIKCA